MKTSLGLLLLFLLLSFGPIPATATTLTSVEVVDLGPDVLVLVKFDAVQAEPVPELKNDPGLIVFDLAETVSMVDWSDKVLDSGILEKISIVPRTEVSPPGIRFVFEVGPGTKCDVDDLGNSLFRFRFFQQAAGISDMERVPVPEPEANPALPVPDQGDSDNYRIGPEDVLHISVFELPSLNQTVRVNEDGTIHLHPLGAIKAENHTTSSLARRLTEFLEEKYVKDPQVLVSITEFRSRKVSIIGAVRKPGEYYLRGQRNLLQLIAQAGGITSDAGKSITIIRPETEQDSQRISIDINQLLTSFYNELNISLKTSDIVYVPIQKMVAFYVYGAVNRPGTVNYSESDQVTILKLLAETGGLRDDAASKRIKIHREKADGTLQILKVNVKKILKGKLPDLDLEPEDIIIVPVSLF